MRGVSAANFRGAGMALTTVNGVDLRGLDFESVIAQVLNPKISKSETPKSTCICHRAIIVSRASARR